MLAHTQASTHSACSYRVIQWQANREEVERYYVRPMEHSEMAKLMERVGMAIVEAGGWPLG